MRNWFQKQWQTITPWHILLMPLSWLFGAIVYIRRTLYQIGLLKSMHLNVPVIVVGNISVGGTGKTPMVIWLANTLKQQGYRPGIISRGYGGSAKQVTEAFAHSNPLQVGDEPVLITKRTACPMFVAADRVLAGKALLTAHPDCNVIISDDGLQHYRLARDMEIALINSKDGFGNHLLLPAGPLREKVARLQAVDAIVDSANQPNLDLAIKLPPQFNLQLQGDKFLPVTGEADGQPAQIFKHKKLVAIAGIGNPSRFFNQLSSMGLQFESISFADHHLYAAEDLLKFADKTLVMTEKDAVKCSELGLNEAWFLPVTANVTNLDGVSLIALLQEKLGI